MKSTHNELGTNPATMAGAKSHGGARRSAGRPKKEPKDRREALNLTIDPTVIAALRKAVPAGERSHFIEEAIKLKLCLNQGTISLSPSPATQTDCDQTRSDRRK